MTTPTPKNAKTSPRAARGDRRGAGQQHDALRRVAVIDVGRRLLHRRGAVHHSVCRAGWRSGLPHARPEHTRRRSRRAAGLASTAKRPTAHPMAASSLSRFDGSTPRSPPAASYPCPSAGLTKRGTGVCRRRLGGLVFELPCATRLRRFERAASARSPPWTSGRVDRRGAEMPEDERAWLDGWKEADLERRAATCFLGLRRRSCCCCLGWSSSRSARRCATRSSVGAEDAKTAGCASASARGERVPACQADASGVGVAALVRLPHVQHRPHVLSGVSDVFSPCTYTWDSSCPLPLRSCSGLQPWAIAIRIGCVVSPGFCFFTLVWAGSCSSASSS